MSEEPGAPLCDVERCGMPSTRECRNTLTGEVYGRLCDEHFADDHPGVRAEKARQSKPERWGIEDK